MSVFCICNMAIHVFHQGGHEPHTILVEAESETEARGHLQRETLSGISPKYRGTASELIEESDAENVADMYRI